MRDFAIVKSIDGQMVEVVSLISDACVTCTSIECAKQGISFHVINKKNIPLKENDIIRIGFSRTLKGILGLISLFFPIVSSVLGFLATPFLAARFDFTVNSSSQACMVGIFFVASCLIVFLVSRTDIHFSHPEVLQLM